MLHSGISANACIRVLSEAGVWQETNEAKERKTAASSGIERIILSEGGKTKVMVMVVVVPIRLFACFNSDPG